MIGLALGILVGIAIDQAWTPGTWASIGVNDASAFMAKRPGEVFAAGKPSDANSGAGAAAIAVRFLVNANAFIGQIFFRALRMIAVPIVLCSLVVGVASLGDIKKLGKIGGRTLGIFAATTVIAIVLGLALANVVKPGRFISEASRAEMLAEHQAQVAASVTRTEELPTGWNTLLEMVPTNPFESLASGNMIQVICVSLLLGIGLTMIDKTKAAAVIGVFDALTDAIVRIVGLVMKLAPIAVFALVAPSIVTMGLHVLGALLVYCLVVVAGLAAIMLIVYPAFLRGMARFPVMRFYKGMTPAMLTAFSSSSSSATLPVTMQCARALGVSNRIASFVCPLGATINMAGTAMYQGIAAVFIAQMYSMDLSFSKQATIVAMATLAGVGTPGIPGSGIVMLVVVLEQVGVPVQGIAVILGVDRLLDMGRTVVNSTGDAMAAIVVARAEGELQEPDRG